MAMAAHMSHSRDPSIIRLDCEVNPNFTFPAHPRPHTAENRPSVSEEPTPRRKSVGAVPSLQARNNLHQLSASDALKQHARVPTLLPPKFIAENGLPSSATPGLNVGKAAGPPTPYYPGGTRTHKSVASVSPTVLNATVTLGPVPGKDKRVDGELLTVPTPTPNPQNEQTGQLPSPQKAQSAGPPPSVNVHSRRGHAHRRSGAISSGDVWALMNNSAPQLSLPNSTNHSRSPSLAPTQPSGQLVTPGSSPVLSWSAPVSPGLKDMTASSSPYPSGDENDSETSAVARKQSRVTFVERVEVIPRPMSAETDASTVRGHGVTDSIASIATATSLASGPDSPVRIPSPSRGRVHNRTRSNSQTLLQPTAALRATVDRDRPSTAGAILDVSSQPGSLKRPAAGSPTLAEFPSPKRSSTKKSHKKAQSDFSGLLSAGKPKYTKDGTVSDSAEGICSLAKKKKRTGKKSKKSKKGKKHIKDWAGTILGKGKELRHSKRGVKIPPKRTPTPPIPMSRSASPTPAEQQWFATSWNESYVIMPVETSPVFNDHVSVSPAQGSPVIDLDAALGPFEKQIGPNAGFAAARRRRMHSAARGSGYYHRRSESMPEMQLFSLGADEPMYDVFEEEEEEEDDSEDDETDESEEEDDSHMDGSEGLGIGMKRDEESSLADWNDDLDMEWGPDDMGRRGSAASAASKKSGASVRNSSTAASSEKSGSASPFKRKEVPADILTSPSAHSSTSTVTASNTQANVSPSLESPATFATAPSSLSTPSQPEFPSDENSSFDIYSDYLGEPGPEMRMSADDIPSLTSSRSTMTMSAAYSCMPSTPGTSDVVPISAPKEKKEKGKRWSRVWGFWRTK